MKKIKMLVIAMAIISGVSAQTSVLTLDTNFVNAQSAQVKGTWIFPSTTDSIVETYSAFDSTLMMPVSVSPNTTTYTGANALTGNTSYNIGGLIPNHKIRAKIHVDKFDSTNVSMFNAYVVFTTDCVFPTIVCTSNSTVCTGASTTLTASGAATYSWSTGNTNASITVSPAATSNYSVTGKNSYGCATMKTVSVTVSPLPTITTSNSTVCLGSSATLTASGGASYLWSNGNTMSSITVSPASTSTYSVTGVSLGCSAVANLTVTIHTASTPIVTASGPLTFCNGGNVTLNSTSNNSYQWKKNGNAISGETLVATTVTQPGIYSVVITDSLGCLATSAGVTINVTGLPVISGGNQISICNGQSTTLSLTGASTYVWSTGATTSSINVSPSSTANYTVTGTMNGCSGTAMTTVTVNSVPMISASANQTVCQGGSVTLNSVGGVSYLWSNGSNGSTITITPTGTTTYVVTGTNSNGCVATATTKVTVNTLPVVSAGVDQTVCAGTLTTLSGAGAVAYAWSNGMNAQMISVSPTVATTYTVTGTVSGGCAGTATVVVNVNPNPPAIISAGGPTTFCQGGSVTLTSSSPTGNNWNTGSFSSGNQSITVVDGCTVNLTVTSGSCSTSAASVLVTVNALPTIVALVVSGPTTFCQGGSVVLGAQNAASYLWSNGETTAGITVTATGNYHLTITDINGCSATSGNVPVSVKTLPSAGISANGSPTTLCAGNSIALSGSGGTAYQWNTGATTQNINVSVTGNYSVTVTGANGCVAVSTAVGIVVNPLPSTAVTVNGASSFCAGGSTQLIGTPFVAGDHFLWNTGETTQTIQASSSGTYWLQTTSAAGCVHSATSPLITELPLPVVTVSNVGSGVLYANANGGIAPYSYFWNPGTSGQSMTYLTTTSYTVTAVDGNGCQGSFSSVVITGIDENGEDDGIKFYPNPTKDVLNMDFPDAGKRFVSVKNNLGQEVRNFSSTDKNLSIQIENLNPGIYFIQIIDENKRVSNKKIIVQ